MPRERDVRNTFKVVALIMQSTDCNAMNKHPTSKKQVQMKTLFDALVVNIL